VNIPSLDGKKDIQCEIKKTKTKRKQKQKQNKNKQKDMKRSKISSCQ